MRIWNFVENLAKKFEDEFQDHIFGRTNCKELSKPTHFPQTIPFVP
jgi:hypothetical protein